MNDTAKAKADAAASVCCIITLPSDISHCPAPCVVNVRLALFIPEQGNARYCLDISLLALI